MRTNAHHTFLGVDLGASSGRVMAGWLDAPCHLNLQEIRRFQNKPILHDGTLCWDFEELMREIFEGLKEGLALAHSAGRPVASIGIDSWAVDFGLMDESGELVGPIVHYRDARTAGHMQKISDKLTPRTIFESTGIQFLPFNTIYQMSALKANDPNQLARATRFMMIADLVAWRLTGAATCEFTNATTTQLFDGARGEWSKQLLASLGLPAKLFHTVIYPGDAIGPLLPELATQWKAAGVHVTAVATHDTGSAVAAVPALEKSFAYLSSGTWSLLGTELPAPIITEEARAANFTNEGGAASTFRFLKNIMGLWIIQECQRHWNQDGKNYDWQGLSHLARDADDCPVLIDVDDARFLPPGDMPSRIREYCREHGTVLGESDGAIVRCVLKSLAARYAEVLATLERLSGRSFDVLHVVGGGMQNTLLCQWTADAIQRPVLAGPAEATVLGNIGVQMIAHGVLSDIEELRGCIRLSYVPVRYDPRSGK